MTRYRKMVGGDDGWSEWVQPKRSLYKMMCCDCGLVHEMQFRVVKNEAASLLVDIGKREPGLVIFRARRNNRATANARRKRPR